MYMESLHFYRWNPQHRKQEGDSQVGSKYIYTHEKKWCNHGQKSFSQKAYTAYRENMLIEALSHYGTHTCRMFVANNSEVGDQGLGIESESS